MEKIGLKAEERIEQGKQAVKKLREQGFIPAVVYKGKRSTSIKVFAKDFMEAIQTKAGENVIINLQLRGEDAKAKTKSKDAAKKSSKNAIIKEIQYHPIKDEILHIDFHEISLDEAIAVKVPASVKGEPVGVKQGGILEHVLWEIEIECLPTQIPENIPVDVSALNIGDSILVKDLKIAEGIKVLTDLEATVVAVAAPRSEEVEQAPLEAEERLEPEVIREKKPEEEAPEEQGTGSEKAKEKKG